VRPGANTVSTGLGGRAVPQPKKRGWRRRNGGSNDGEEALVLRRRDDGASAGARPRVPCSPPHRSSVAHTGLPDLFRHSSFLLPSLPPPPSFSLPTPPTSMITQTNHARHRRYRNPFQALVDAVSSEHHGSLFSLYFTPELLVPTFIVYTVTPI